MTNDLESQQNQNVKPVSVRAAAAEDIPRLVEIAKEAGTAAQWKPEEYEKIFATNGITHRAALVAEKDGRVAGFVIGHQIREEWEIENVAVAPEARRLGLGEALLREFLHMAGGRGCHTIFLEVRESNLAARALYEKCGFLESGRRKMYYADPPEDAQVLIFNFY